MAIDHAVLGTHINADPDSRGFAALITAGSDHLIADALNLPRSTKKVNRGLIPTVEVTREFDPDDLDSLTDKKLRQLAVVVSDATVDASNANTKAMLGKIFAGKTNTLTALQALAKRDGSDIEALFEIGDRVNHSDIAKALRP